MMLGEDQTLPEMPDPPGPPPPTPARPGDELGRVLDDLALQLGCPTCGTGPGVWCMTRSGHGAASLHARRTMVVAAVFWRGWHAHEKHRQAGGGP